MSRLIKTAVLACVVMMAGTASAQIGKIAVFSPQDAVLNTELAKQRLQKLSEDKDFVSNKNEAEKLQKEFRKLAENFNKESAVMSNAQKAESQKKMTALRADIEHIAKKLQAAQNEVVQKLGGEIGPKMQKIVEDLIKEDSIGLLLRTEAVMHASANYNITSKVTDRLNSAK